jgi:hypothetical protein
MGQAFLLECAAVPSVASSALSALLGALTAPSAPATAAIMCALAPVATRHAPLVSAHLAPVAIGISAAAASLSAASKATRTDASERLGALIRIVLWVWPCAVCHACRSVNASAAGMRRDEEVDVVTSGALGALRASVDALLGMTPALLGLKGVAQAANDVGQLIQQPQRLSGGFQLLQVCSRFEDLR